MKTKRITEFQRINGKDKWHFWSIVKVSKNKIEYEVICNNKKIKKSRKSKVSKLTKR